MGDYLLTPVRDTSAETQLLLLLGHFRFRQLPSASVIFCILLPARAHYIILHCSSLIVLYDKIIWYIFSTYAFAGFCRHMSREWPNISETSNIQIYKIRPAGIEPSTYGL